MNRGVWLATIYGVARVGHALVTKPPPEVILRFTIGVVHYGFGQTCNDMYPSLWYYTEYFHYPKNILCSMYSFFP